ncbi:IclR family transcriptional regulator [Rhodococcus sp. NPDC057014]|uniref:IclR family transcriptional regulator n=1 Tax=Rhodococcus sp. NPDC057014 TaxID=3346000 RepID=UPI00363365D0
MVSEELPAGTQSVGRALAVLKLLASSADELTGSAIAAELRLSSGTANRLIRALIAEGLVARNPMSDSYYLGSGTVLLGQAAQRGFGMDKALPILEQLNAETQESVNLSIRQGSESVVMMRVQSTLPLRFEQHTGARFPLYTTASGKAILAFSPHAETYVESLPPTLAKVTPHSLSTPRELSEQLREIRVRGYSIDEQENVEGVRCVGAPILDADGYAQAALVIQVPTVRMPKSRVRTLGDRIVQAAKEVSQFVPVNRAMSH